MIEQLLLGLVAFRVGQKIDYDPSTGRVSNSDQANAAAEQEIPPRLDTGRVVSVRPKPRSPPPDFDAAAASGCSAAAGCHRPVVLAAR